MSGRMTTRTAMLASGAVIAALAMVSTGAPALASANDRDRDGIPNRWETNHGLNPRFAGDARRDPDHDGLTNLGEYRNGGMLRDEDTDNDGQDDRDELRTRTDVRDADSDNDGRRDGDEDADRDRIRNEDEDDATEPCIADDDDRDGDNVADEDENELGLRLGDADSDNDGAKDGAEDRDHDGETNEDEDDALDDSCSRDRDGDGIENEDEGDLLGTVLSFDRGTLALVVELPASAGTLPLTLSGDTELEFEYPDDYEGEERPATLDDLTEGAQLSEVEVDDDTDLVESLEIIAS